MKTLQNCSCFIYASSCEAFDCSAVVGAGNGARVFPPDGPCPCEDRVEISGRLIASKVLLCPVMASQEASNPTSPAPSDSANSSDSSVEAPEALAFGREKRATAGNKLRALLDAEFQEEEIFKEDEDDEEF